LSFGLRLRRTWYGTFTSAEQEWDQLRSHDSTVGRDSRIDYVVETDDTGAIGKLYRRQDEIGTPLCVTVDFQSIDDQTVTVRDRDTMAQDRVAIGELKDYVEEKLAS
jgi:glycyl-tRNA synthetase